MKFLNNIDLQKNEIQNFRVQNLAAAPENPVVGQHYFNTVDATEYVWNGTKWIDALSQGDYTFENGIKEEGRHVSLTAATADAIGGVTIGDNIDVADGKISVKSGNKDQAGLLALATDEEAAAGTEDTKAVTAKQVAAAIDADLTAVNAAIAKNVEDIAANLAAIQANDADIAKNAEDIAKNAEDIAKNAEDIATNAQGVADNKANLEAHTGNAEIHVTADDKLTWSGKQDALTENQLKAVNSGITAEKVAAYDGIQAQVDSKVSQADYDAKMQLLDAEDAKAQAHREDTVVHVTAADKALWTAKQDALTGEQMNAVNSGITADKVAAYDAYAQTIADNKKAAEEAIAAVDGKADKNAQDIVTANEAIAKNAGDIVTANENIGKNAEAIAANGEAIAANTKAIADNKAAAEQALADHEAQAALDLAAAKKEALDAVVAHEEATTEALATKVDKNADITAGTHTKITYDAKGLVTGGADLEEADIPALHLTKITDVTVDAAEVNMLDGIKANIQEQLDAKLAAADVPAAISDLVDDTDTKPVARATADKDGNAIDTTYVKKELLGAANGVATLGADGLVPAAQLPSYVDDVVELIAIGEKPAECAEGDKCFADGKLFTATAANTWDEGVNPESDKIYVNLANNMSYRWGGTTMVQIGADKLKGFNGQIIGDGATTTFTINHNLGTRNVVFEIYEAAAPFEKVYVQVLHTSLTALQVVFSQAPEVGTDYNLTVIAIA